jgi:hypothetical protein
MFLKNFAVVVASVVSNTLWLYKAVVQSGRAKRSCNAVLQCRIAMQSRQLAIHSAH